MLMTLQDGYETYIDRCVFKTEDDFRADGPVLGWLGADDRPVETVEDRFTAQIISRRPNGNLDIWGPLSETGFEHLSLDDALVLGFTTTEYQAGLRHRLLRGLLLQSEEQLSMEMSPPADEWQAAEREGLGDWTEWNPVRRVPYPLQAGFERDEVIGWAAGNMPDGAELPEDRLFRETIVRNRETGVVSRSGIQLKDCGIESLSLRDALVLGFTTSDYQTALRVRIIERRHIIDEADLAISKMPPVAVRHGLETHGRDCSYRIGKGFLWTHENWEKERALREWVSRVERPMYTKPISRPSRGLLTPSF
ncbi:hypothetical protein [Rhizobium leguminosarum]|uniref:hypothetical protein n=1 Tax=Rhizobium leguminosarum TaxID=384 RepID=UPI00103CC4AA|nr:hypothetical protein [Rhizobium leguminosarum]TBZ79683.1 hypothetical protein E0H53_31820 [Rhizobium leguminosarum bv. viciae]TBZ97045.1 hypothetical protein E0H63_30050 [Rhizobium leguminosarum bv. viciae]